EAERGRAACRRFQPVLLGWGYLRIHCWIPCVVERLLFSPRQCAARRYFLRRTTVAIATLANPRFRCAHLRAVIPHLTKETPLTETTFGALGVPTPLVNALDTSGITSPFPIQVDTLPDT